jgi:PadR family transcriptional regulator, regulatory protein PadR
VPALPVQRLTASQLIELNRAVATEYCPYVQRQGTPSLSVRHMSDKRMTDSTLQVLHALLADPTRERYGLELSKSSGMAHGTMYGILVRLEDWGWLENRLDYVADRATPPRRYYRLTSDGAERARAAVEQAEHRATRGRRQRRLSPLGKKAGYSP